MAHLQCSVLQQRSAVVCQAGTLKEYNLHMKAARYGTKDGKTGLAMRSHIRGVRGEGRVVDVSVRPAGGFLSQTRPIITCWRI